MDDSTVNVGTRPPPVNLCLTTDSTYPKSPDTGRLMSLRRDPLPSPHYSCLQGQSWQPFARPLARKPPAQAQLLHDAQGGTRYEVVVHNGVNLLKWHQSRSPTVVETA